MKALSILILATLAMTTLAANDGRILIMINNQPKTLYVLSSDYDRQFISVSNTSVTLSGGGRVYIGQDPSNDLKMNSYYEFDFLDDKSMGKRLSYDVDMSRVGCSCNGALYLVSMPAYNSGQQPEPGKDGAYYCDANDVGGTYCPEMDIMEMNKYAMASTAHTCDYKAPHYYDYCDKGGCGTNVLDAHSGKIGPGKSVIDTDRPFKFSVDFKTQGGNLATVTNTFMQDGRTITFDACNASYLQWMGKSLPGMVMVMSLWGTGPGGMSWLDGKSGCYGDCTGDNLRNSRVTFSNIHIDNI